MSPDDLARHPTVAKHDEQRAIEHLEAGGVEVVPGMAHIVTMPAELPEGFTEEGEMGPWAREYGCGCREVLTDDEATVASDACPKHGSEVVCVGYLTLEADVDALRDERDKMLSALRRIALNLRPEGFGVRFEHDGDAASFAWSTARAAIAAARGQREDG